MSPLLMIMIYLVAMAFIGGIMYRMWGYYKSPAPLSIPTMPAPLTTQGVVWRLTREVVFFESLFKSNKMLWFFGFLFHFSLLLIVIRHLRYFVEPMGEILTLVQPFGKYAGITMVLALAGLFLRRVVIDRVRYISSLSDYLMLALLFAIGATGLMMSFVVHTDVVGIKRFFLGVISFEQQPFSGDFLFVLHLLLVGVLMVIFPFSKLLHAPGIFFSPTRNQKDDPRDRRRIAPWAQALEQQPKE